MAVISCEWSKLPKALREILFTDVLCDELDPALGIDYEYCSVDILIPKIGGKFSIERAHLYVHQFNTNADDVKELVKHICNNTFSYICCCLLPLNLSAADKHKIAMLLTDYNRYTIVDINRTITEDAEIQDAAEKRERELFAKHKGA